MEKITKGYSSIPHLSGSKMTSKEDIRLLNGEEYFTIKTKEKKDKVLILEKIDGCCISVRRDGDTLIPATRNGFSIDDGQYAHIKAFLPFLEENKQVFLSALADGETVYGEWTFAEHGTPKSAYKKLFYPFDIVGVDGKIPYLDVQRRFDGVSEKIGSPEVIAFSPTRPEKIYNWTLAGCEADCGLDEWSDDTTVWADGSYEYALEQGHCQPFE